MKQWLWTPTSWLSVNIFNVPMGDFGVFGKRLSIHIGNFHALLTWKQEKKKDE